MSSATVPTSLGERRMYLIQPFVRTGARAKVWVYGFLSWTGGANCHPERTASVASGKRRTPMHRGEPETPPRRTGVLRRFAPQDDNGSSSTRPPPQSPIFPPCP